MTDYLKMFQWNGMLTWWLPGCNVVYLLNNAQSPVNEDPTGVLQPPTTMLEGHA